MAEAGTIAFKLIGNTAKFQKALQGASAKLKKFGDESKRIAAQAGVAFAGMGLAVKKVASTYAEFDRGLQRTGAIAGATGKETKQLGNLAVDLAKRTKFSASEVVQAYQFMAMAGQDVNTMMGSIGPTLELAAAGALDLGTAADITTGVMAAFGKRADELSEVNNILAKVITSTKTDVSGLGQSFQKVGSIAQSAGVDFQSMTVALGLLGQQNLSGAEAGTAMKTALARMLSPAGEAKKEIDRLGISFKTAEGRIRPLVDIIRDLEMAGADATSLVKLFGTRGMLPMSILVQQGADKFERLNTLLTNHGNIAQRLADLEMQTLAGRINAMKASVEGATIAFGQGMEPATRKLVDTIGQLASRFANLPEETQRSMATMLMLGTVIAGVVTAMGTLGAAFPVIVAGLKAATLSGGKFLAILLPIISAAGIAGMLGQIAGGDIGGLRKQLGVDENTGLFEAFKRVGVESLKRGLEPIGDLVGDIFGKVDTTLDASISSTKTKLASLDQEIKQTAKSFQGIDQAVKGATKGLDFGAAALAEETTDFSAIEDMMYAAEDATKAAKNIDFNVLDTGTAGPTLGEKISDIVSGTFQEAMQRAAPRVVDTINAAVQGFSSGGGPFGAIVAVIVSLLMRMKSMMAALRSMDVSVGMLVAMMNKFFQKGILELTRAMQIITTIVFKLLAPALKLLGGVLEVVGEILMGLVSSLAQVWNRLIALLAKALRKLGFKGTAKKLAKQKINLDETTEIWGSEIQTAAEHTEEFNDAVGKATESLTNVPQGFKVAIERFRAIAGGGVGSVGDEVVKTVGATTNNNVAVHTTQYNFGGVTITTDNIGEMVESVVETYANNEAIIAANTSTADSPADTSTPNTITSIPSSVEVDLSGLGIAFAR